MTESNDMEEDALNSNIEDQINIQIKGSELGGNRSQRTKKSSIVPPSVRDHEFGSQKHNNERVELSVPHET